MLTQQYIPKSVKFQNNGKNDSTSGTWAPPGGTIFLFEILILVSSIFSQCLKKLNGFFMGKNSIFQNNKVENFKNLEIFQSKRDFFNFLQVIAFDKFMLAKNWEKRKILLSENHYYVLIFEQLSRYKLHQRP